MSSLNPFLTLLSVLFLCAVSVSCQNALQQASNGKHDASASTGMTLFLTFSALFFFMLAKASGPGYLPPGWTPADPSAALHLDPCSPCGGLKAPRAHHCTRCGRCVKRMDHHCPFLNSCVGYDNHSAFLYLLLLGMAGLVQGTRPMMALVARYVGLTSVAGVLGYPGHFRSELPVTFGGMLIVAIAAAMATIMLMFVILTLCYQIRGLVNNETMVELMTRQLAARRGRPLENPYDLNPADNVYQVFNCNGSRFTDRTGVEGTAFPVRAGSDRYSVMKEKRLQKAERHAMQDGGGRGGHAHGHAHHDVGGFSSSLLVTMGAVQQVGGPTNHS